MPDLVDVNKLKLAEDLDTETPIPTQIISNGEFTPQPQTKQQKQVEERMHELADTHGKKRGMDRRSFLRSTSGMAAGFLAMNEVFGPMFNVSEAEAADAEQADARAKHLAGQFIFDDQTHMVHDGFEQEGLLGLGVYASQNWNPDLKGDELTLAYYKFDNYMRQIFVNSDTKIALLSGAPFDDPSWNFVSNEAIVNTVAMVNKLAGTRRMFGHHVITPGKPGWMDEVDKALESGAHMDGWKAYTIGDPLSASTERPYRLDDEELMYPFFEKAVKYGKTNFACHKGLMPADYETSWKDKWQYNTVWDVAKAAKDWPEINFIIYHSGMRPFLEDPTPVLEEFEATGELKWASDLARIPARARRHQRLRRAWHHLRQLLRHASASGGSDAGNADQGPWRRQDRLGYGLCLLRLAAMADRGFAPAGDPRGYAGEAWLCAAGRRGWACQKHHLRSEFGAPVQGQPTGRTGADDERRRSEA